MKETIDHYIILTLLMLMPIIGISKESDHQQQIPLLPEVEQQLLLPPFDKKWLDNNLYLDFATLFYQGDNAKEIGSQLIHENYKILQNCLLETICITDDEPTYSIMLEEITDSENISPPIIGNVVYSWIDSIDFIHSYNEADLFERIFAAKNHPKSNIESNYQRNRAIIDRYHQLLPNNNRYEVIPNLNLYPYHPFLISTSHGHVKQTIYPGSYMDLSNLLLSKGILFIAEGEVEKGLDLIEYEYDLASFIVKSGNDLIDAPYFMMQLETIYFIINDLLQRGILDPYFNHALLQKINTLFFTQESFNILINNTLKNSMITQLRYDYLFLQNNISKVSLPWGEISNYREIDHNSTINLLYKYYGMLMKEYQNKQSLINATSTDYQKNLTKWWGINKINQAAPKNQITSQDKYIVMDSQYHENTIRYYKSVTNIQKMLIIKFRIRQKRINAEDIPTYLDSLKELNRDLLTDTPFVYDPDNQTLTGHYTELYNPDEEGIYEPIPFSIPIKDK